MAVRPEEVEEVASYRYDDLTGERLLEEEAAMLAAARREERTAEWRPSPEALRLLEGGLCLPVPRPRARHRASLPHRPQLPLGEVAVPGLCLPPGGPGAGGRWAGTWHLAPGP